LPIKEILKVLYSPHKAFRDILQNPKISGPILIMILFVAASVGAIYIFYSRTYYEDTLPTSILESDISKKDLWTEKASFWRNLEGEPPMENYEDYINGTLYGNRSIEFHVKNSQKISVILEDIGKINCSSPNGYSKLYFSVKWIGLENNPEDAVLYLFSGFPSSYFRLSLVEELANTKDGVWNSVAVSLGDGGWASVGTADWTSITGLQLELSWSEASNITLLVDGVFFGGVFKPLENFTFIPNYAILAFMQFVFRWVLLAGVIYVMTRGFKAGTVWRIIIILVGFALIPMVVQAIVNAAVFSIIPAIKYSFEYLVGFKGEAAYNIGLLNQIFSYIQAAIIIWTIVLCAFAIRTATEFSWSKTFLIAAVAYFAATTIESFLIGI